METVECECKNCGINLAKFINLWTQVGKTYFSPVLEAIGDVKINAQEPTRVGEPQTLVAECELQDIACARCKNVIGITCLSSPINHVLEDSQILIRQTSVLLLTSDREPAELKVRRTLKLRECSKTKSDPQFAFHNSSDFGQCYDSGFMDDDTPLDTNTIGLVHIQADLDNQREDIERIDTAGYQAVSQFNDALSRIDDQVRKLNGTVTELRRNIDCNNMCLSEVREIVSTLKHTAHQHPAIIQLEYKLKSAEESIAGMEKLCADATDETDEVRRELQITKDDLRRLENVSSSLRKELSNARKATKETLSTAEENAKDMVNLRMELKQLKQIIEQDRPRAFESKPQPLIPRELDILASNITKIGNRASLVESLQMELDLFKTRVQRLEESVESSSRARDDFSPKSVPPDEYSERLESANGSRSRPSTVRQGPDQFDNQPAENGKYPSKASQPRTRKRKGPSERSSKPQETMTTPGLTKSGAIDKRTNKKQRRGPSVGDSELAGFPASG